MPLSKLRRSARGEICQMRSPVCNGNPETTVLCHLNGLKSGKGMGLKPDDTKAFYGCSSCHDLYDGRRQSDISRDALELMVEMAVISTHARMLAKGVI